MLPLMRTCEVTLTSAAGLRHHQRWPSSAAVAAEHIDLPSTSSTSTPFLPPKTTLGSNVEAASAPKQAHRIEVLPRRQSRETSHPPTMTRRIVYGISLWVFVASAALTIAAIALPNWISYTSPTDNDPIRVTYGLHKRCSSITGKCTPFPQDEDCHGEDRYFCSVWRSTGFFMNFTIVCELAVLVAYITVLVGGRGAREAGWKMVSGLLSAVAASQIIAMALVVSPHEKDIDVRY